MPAMDLKQCFEICMFVEEYKNVEQKQEGSLIKYRNCYSVTSDVVHKI